MSKMKLFALSLLVLSQLVVGQYATAGEVWTIDDAHSTLGFKIRHLMVTNVTGKFSGIKGKFDVDTSDFTKSKIEGEVDTKTVNTDNAKRDDHLRSEDFFDAKKFPKMVFKSKKIEKTGDKFKVIGDLTLHGVTKEIALDAEALTPVVKDPWGNQKRGFSATTKINRQDFGLKWNKNLDGGGVVLGEEVTVNADFELLASAPADKKKS